MAQSKSDTLGAEEGFLFFICPFGDCLVDIFTGYVIVKDGEEVDVADLDISCPKCETPARSAWCPPQSIVADIRGGQGG
jgi:hypothetical protein